jgi:hypothetical protein
MVRLCGRGRVVFVVFRGDVRAGLVTMIGREPSPICRRLRMRERDFSESGVGSAARGENKGAAPKSGPSEDTAAFIR